jgi:glycosyltransferase involved in cell wall biosynthesis
VTNDALASRVAELGGRALIVSDIPFEFPAPTARYSGGEFSIAYVCSFAHDEPYLEVIEAARSLPEIRFYISGNHKRARALDSAAVPANVTLTGFLQFHDYANLLHSVSAVLALTTRDFTMQRAGSEAVTVGKPLITSDWPTLRRIFRQGTVFVASEAAAIVEGVRALTTDYARLQAEMLVLRDLRDATWQDAKRNLESALGFSLPPERREHR